MSGSESADSDLGDCRCITTISSLWLTWTRRMFVLNKSSTDWANIYSLSLDPYIINPWQNEGSKAQKLWDPIPKCSMVQEYLRSHWPKECHTKSIWLEPRVFVMNLPCPFIFCLVVFFLAMDITFGKRAPSKMMETFINLVTMVGWLANFVDMAKLGMCKFHLSKDVSIYGIILPVMISYVGIITSHYKDPY